MSDEILKVVNKLYKQGDFQYVLGKFVDKHFEIHVIIWKKYILNF
ncbi:hypothetical protein [Bacillus thuringiensis]|nr:hypothetical protein [Bacillus thuringiensis]